MEAKAFILSIATKYYMEIQKIMQFMLEREVEFSYAMLIIISLYNKWQTPLIRFKYNYIF